ncbi:hypothetical protein SLA2020_273450 [Shorea laevis]
MKKKKQNPGLSKAKKASAKKESRENIKKARRDRLDPVKSSTTTLDLLKQSLEKETLNEKQRRGLERQHEGIQQKKRKRDYVSEEKKPATSSSADKVEKDVVEASKGLAFGHVKLGNEEEHGKKKKAKLSKFKELERAKNWKKQRKILRKPVEKEHTKEKKRHQKNAEKWKERLQTTVKMKGEKQQKRSENIAQRIQDKKMRRIAKREKKLMRPGFEGRKEGFVNDGGSS